MRSDLVDLTLILGHQTDRAYGFKETEDQTELQWVPKSMCEIEPTKKPRVVVATMLQSVAEEKGFV